MTEMTPPPADSHTTTPYTDRTRLGQYGHDLGYLLSGLPLGIVAFVIGVAGFSVGVASFVTALGLPVLVGTLTAARGIARVERRRVESVTRRPLPPHYYRERRGTGVSGMLRALRQPQSWRDLLHMLVAFPVRVVSFCVALVWSVGGVGELLYGVWSWPIPRNDETGLLDLMFGITSRAADIGFNTLVGVLLLASSGPVLRGLVWMNAALAKGMLTNQFAAYQARAASTVTVQPEPRHRPTRNLAPAALGDGSAQRL